MSEVVSILRDMVGIQSDRNESGMVAYLASRFDAMAIPYITQDVAGDGRENIIAAIGAGEPSLVLNSHMDTVEIGEADDWSSEPFGAQTADGYMYGRGTADAKGSLAAMVAAFEATARADLKSGRLILMAVAGEETMGLGTEVGVASGLDAQAAIVGEPTNLDICIAHKGVVRMNITAHGKAAHASEPWEGKNAIIDMMPVIASLQELARRIEKRSDPLLGRASLAVTLIQGGIARNVIPQRCTVSIDRRYLPSEAVTAVQEEIAQILEAHSADASLSVDPVSVAQAAHTKADDRFVQLALRARDEVLGSTGQSAPRGFAACCDMWHLKNTGGIPTVIVGPGSLSQAHKTDERIPITELEDAVRLYRRIILGRFAEEDA